MIWLTYNLEASAITTVVSELFKSDNKINHTLTKKDRNQPKTDKKR